LSILWTNILGDDNYSQIDTTIHQQCPSVTDTYIVKTTNQQCCLNRETRHD